MQLLLMLYGVKSCPIPFASHAHDVLASVPTLAAFRLSRFSSPRKISVQHYPVTVVQVLCFLFLRWTSFFSGIKLLPWQASLKQQEKKKICFYLKIFINLLGMSLSHSDIPAGNVQRSGSAPVKRLQQINFALQYVRRE